MANSITLGGQIFIKTTAGWIDKKTKKPVDTSFAKVLDAALIKDKAATTAVITPLPSPAGGGSVGQLDADIKKLNSTDTKLNSEVHALESTDNKLNKHLEELTKSIESLIEIMGVKQKDKEDTAASIAPAERQPAPEVPSLFTSITDQLGFKPGGRLRESFEQAMPPTKILFKALDRRRAEQDNAREQQRSNPSAPPAPPETATPTPTTATPTVAPTPTAPTIKPGYTFNERTLRYHNETTRKMVRASEATEPVATPAPTTIVPERPVREQSRVGGIMSDIRAQMGFGPGGRLRESFEKAMPPTKLLFNALDRQRAAKEKVAEYHQEHGNAPTAPGGPSAPPTASETQHTKPTVVHIDRMAADVINKLADAISKAIKDALPATKDETGTDDQGNQQHADQGDRETEDRGDKKQRRSRRSRRGRRAGRRPAKRLSRTPTGESPAEAVEKLPPNQKRAALEKLKDLKRPKFSQGIKMPPGGGMAGGAVAAGEGAALAGGAAAAGTGAALAGGAVVAEGAALAGGAALAAGGTAAGGAALAAGGTAAAAGAGAAAAGLGAAAVAAAPWILGAAAIAGVGFLGYKAYKHYKKGKDAKKLAAAERLKGEGKQPEKAGKPGEPAETQESQAMQAKSDGPTPQTQELTQANKKNAAARDAKSEAKAPMVNINAPSSSTTSTPPSVSMPTLGPRGSLDLRTFT
jgi:hypothetical protein